MIDLRKLVVLLDCACHCGDRECPECRSLFGFNRDDNTCPMWHNKDNMLEALKAIEKWLDDEYDINCQLGTKPTYEVSEEEFIKILTGET